MKTHQLLLAIGLLILPISLYAQDSVAIKNARIKQHPEAFNNMYMGLELGRAPGYKEFGQLALHVQGEGQYLKIKFSNAHDKYTVTKHHNENESKDCNCTDANGVQDISFMYGRSIRFLNFMLVQFGAGPSLFIKTTPDETHNSTKQPDDVDKYKHRYGPGLTTEVRYVVQIKRYLAFSTSVHMSSNAIKSYNGWSSGIALGLF
jgi:hypothetical protein